MSSATGVTAAILAGGLGTRLRAVVSGLPKVLADVRGRPFLARLLDQVKAAGIGRVVLCTGYMGEEIQAVFGDSYGELRLAYSHEQSPLGTAGALRLALPLLNSDTVLVLNGDSFCQADLTAFLNWHVTRGAGASMLLVRVSDTSRYGQVEVDSEGQVRKFVEKGETKGPGWINAGIYLISRSFLGAIPAGVALSIEKEIFPTWSGRGLLGCQSTAPFIDIGTPESYTRAKQFFF